jgi:hypothetical protein
MVKKKTWQEIMEESGFDPSILAPGGTGTTPMPTLPPPPTNVEIPKPEEEDYGAGDILDQIEDFLDLGDGTGGDIPYTDQPLDTWQPPDPAIEEDEVDESDYTEFDPSGKPILTEEPPEPEPDDTDVSPDTGLGEGTGGVTAEGEYVGIPYMGEVSPQAQVYMPHTTPFEQSLRELTMQRAKGMGIERLSAEKIKEFMPIVEQIMQPRYKEAMRREAEKWSAAGRSFDTKKLDAVGDLTMKHGAQKASMALGMAVDDVNRINREAGIALGKGLTLAQMEQSKYFLSAGQANQLNMYKRKVRDSAIAAVKDKKYNFLITKLERAWEEEDWDKYKTLAKQLSDAGQPDLGDYLWSLAETVIPAVI